MDSEIKKRYNFVYGTDREKIQFLLKYVDCGKISPEYIGCLAGTLIGAHASSNGKDSDNYAEFDWFEMKETE